MINGRCSMEWPHPGLTFWGMDAILSGNWLLWVFSVPNLIGVIGGLDTWRWGIDKFT